LPSNCVGAFNGIDTANLDYDNKDPFNIQYPILLNGNYRYVAVEAHTPNRQGVFVESSLASFSKLLILLGSRRILGLYCATHLSKREAKVWAR
jgi:hypothetical protein